MISREACASVDGQKGAGQYIGRRERSCGTPEALGDIHMTQFTPDSLVAAVTQLFELNNYRVEGPIQVHGAEVDLVATPLGDPFGRKVYIEATVEHVDNTKYGKDVGKLAMIANLEP